MLQPVRTGTKWNDYSASDATSVVAQHIMANKLNQQHRRTWYALILTISMMLVASCTTDSVQSMNINGGTVTPGAVIQLTIALPTTAGDTQHVAPQTAPATSLPPTKNANEGLAARVNGQPITLAQFSAEMTRYLVGDPTVPSLESPEAKQLALQYKDVVLGTLIDRTLIAQDAKRVNIAVTDKAIDDEVAAMIASQGGQATFQQWLGAGKESEQGLRDIVRYELLATMMRDRIVEQLPRTAEYIHAYQVVLATEAVAQSTLAKLKAGAKFTTVAQSISIDISTKADGGDLGWFTRGTGVILWSEVEEAAFSLKVGQISPIIHSPIGYHVIRVAERQTRALTPNDSSYIQQAAIEQWINRLRTNAKIERYI